MDATDRFVREAFRPLTQREQEILSFLLSVEMEGINELREQAGAAQAARWKCGCSSFELLVDRSRAPQSSITSRPAVEADTKERIDVTGAFNLLLWVSDGWLSGVEIVDYVERHGFDSPDPIPPVELWEAPRRGGFPA